MWPDGARTHARARLHTHTHTSKQASANTHTHTHTHTQARKRPVVVEKVFDKERPSKTSDTGRPAKYV